jgi:hypothetical protein
MSGYLDGVLRIELKTSGEPKEKYAKDTVYNAILSAIASIEEAIEQHDLLVQQLNIEL